MGTAGKNPSIGPSHTKQFLLAFLSFLITVRATRTCSPPGIKHERAEHVRGWDKGGGRGGGGGGGTCDGGDQAICTVLRWFGRGGRPDVATSITPQEATIGTQARLERCTASCQAMPRLRASNNDRLHARLPACLPACLNAPRRRRQAQPKHGVPDVQRKYSIISPLDAKRNGSPTNSFPTCAQAEPFFLLAPLPSARSRRRFLLVLLPSSPRRRRRRAARRSSKPSTPSTIVASEVSTTNSAFF